MLSVWLCSHSVISSVQMLFWTTLIFTVRTKKNKILPNILFCVPLKNRSHTHLELWSGWPFLTNFICGQTVPLNYSATLWHNVIYDRNTCLSVWKQIWWLNSTNKASSMRKMELHYKKVTVYTFFVFQNTFSVVINNVWQMKLIDRVLLIFNPEHSFKAKLD